MYKRSHKALALAITPLAFISLPTIGIKQLSLVDTYLEKYNNFFSGILSMDLTTSVTTSLISTILLFICYMIGTATPDLDQNLRFFYKEEDRHKRYLFHRQFTHSVILSVGILTYGLYLMDTNMFIASAVIGFAMGIIAHQIGDILTGSIPWAFYGPYYIRFSRIGITVFLPKSMHKIFTERLPQYLNKNNKKIFIPLFFICLFITKATFI